MASGSGLLWESTPNILLSTDALPRFRFPVLWFTIRLVFSWLGLRLKTSSRFFLLQVTHLANQVWCCSGHNTYNVSWWSVYQGWNGTQLFWWDLPIKNVRNLWRRDLGRSLCDDFVLGLPTRWSRIATRQAWAFAPWSLNWFSTAHWSSICV